MGSSEKIYQKLLQRNYPVIKINEYKSTITCSHCKNESLEYEKMTNPKYKKFLKENELKESDLSLAKFLEKHPKSKKEVNSRMAECNDCGKHIHRDVNGARNIAFNLKTDGESVTILLVVYKRCFTKPKEDKQKCNWLDKKKKTIEGDF